LSNNDGEQEQGQGDSTEEEEEDSEMEEERDARVDEVETKEWSAVVRTQTGYAFADTRRQRTRQVTRTDDQGACVEEEALEVSTSASTQNM